MRRDLDELLSSLSGQIGWLTIQPFIHDPNEKGPLMTHRRKGGGGCVSVCASWYETKNRWRWGYDGDDQSPFFFFFFCYFWLGMKPKNGENYLRVHLTQSIPAWAAFSRIRRNLIRSVQTRGARLWGEKFGAITQSAPRPPISSDPFRNTANHLKWLQCAGTAQTHTHTHTHAQQKHSPKI